jgi:hypothetical protein
LRTRALFEEVEPRYEDSALLHYVAHSHDCARSRRNTSKATDRQREPVRSDEAEGARWLQARRNGQGNEALGGRMHGDAGPKNGYASRRVESDVGPRRDGRGHSEGSAVTSQLIAFISCFFALQVDAGKTAVIRLKNYQFFVNTFLRDVMFERYKIQRSWHWK